MLPSPSASVRFGLVGALALLNPVGLGIASADRLTDYTLGSGQTYRTPAGDTVFDVWRLGIAVSAHGPVAVFAAPAAASVLYYTEPSRPQVISLSNADTSQRLQSEALSWRGDTLIVIDKHLNRVARIDSHGQVLSVNQLPSIHPIGQFQGMLPEAILEDGSLLALPYLTQTDLRAGTKHVPVLRIRPGSRRGQQMATLRVGAGTFILATIDGSIVVQSPPLLSPFDNSSFLSFGPNGHEVYVVERDVNRVGIASVRIRRLSGDKGGTSFATVWSEHYQARRPRSGYLDSLVDVAASQFDTVYGSHQAAIANVRAAIHVRPVLAPVTDVQVASDEVLWLERERTGTASCRWDRLDVAQHRYTGTLTTECVWHLAAAVGDTVWMTRFVGSGVLLRQFELVPATRGNAALR